MCTVGVMSAVGQTGFRVMGNLDQREQDISIANQNLETIDAQRRDVTQAGANAAARAVAEGRDVSAQAQVAAAASGVGGASVENVQTRSGVSAAMDAELIRAQAARQAFGLDVEAEQISRQTRASTGLGSIIGGRR